MSVDRNVQLLTLLICCVPLAAASVVPVPLLESVVSDPSNTITEPGVEVSELGRGTSAGAAAAAAA